jgi:hypothetical protein
MQEVDLDPLQPGAAAWQASDIESILCNPHRKLSTRGVLRPVCTPVTRLYRGSGFARKTSSGTTVFPLAHELPGTRQARGAPGRTVRDDGDVGRAFPVWNAVLASLVQSPCRRSNSSDDGNA